MVAVDSILSTLDLEPLGTNQYRGANVTVGHGVVFGGQLLAQSIVAALRGNDGKLVKTVHTVFARGATTELPVDILVDPMASGRSMASSTVSISQDGRLCTRSIVLMSADEPDLIRHADPAPAVAGPDETPVVPGHVEDGPGDGSEAGSGEW